MSPVPEGSNVILLCFVPAENADARTGRFVRFVEGSTEEIQVYKNYHPLTESSLGSTTIQRMNPATGRWESAVEIEYHRNHHPTVVHFGIETVNVRDLRKMNKSSSKSRRFKVDGSEFKWKLEEETGDLYCVDSRGKIVASWADKDYEFRLVEKHENSMDRFLTTCLVNLWWKKALLSW